MSGGKPNPSADDVDDEKFDYVDLLEYL